jgi:hypothetical protein
MQPHPSGPASCSSRSQPVTQMPHKRSGNGDCDSRCSSSRPCAIPSDRCGTQDILRLHLACRTSPCGSCRCLLCCKNGGACSGLQPLHTAGALTLAHAYPSSPLVPYRPAEATIADITSLYKSCLQEYDYEVEEAWVSSSSSASSKRSSSSASSSRGSGSSSRHCHVAV